MNHSLDYTTRGNGHHKDWLTKTSSLQCDMTRDCITKCLTKQGISKLGYNQPKIDDQEIRDSTYSTLIVRNIKCL